MFLELVSFARNVNGNFVVRETNARDAAKSRLGFSAAWYVLTGDAVFGASGAGVFILLVFCLRFFAPGGVSALKISRLVFVNFHNLLFPALAFDLAAIPRRLVASLKRFAPTLPAPTETQNETSANKSLLEPLL